ncbi:MAG: TIR domain-containing protein [Clostridia bacterium]|nr:TIR domain-containing protein [Clostridia bacterium]
MGVVHCKMCGGALNIVENVSVVTCEFCDTQQTIPTVDDEKIAQLFERANYYRLNNEFDKAAVIYENIVGEKNNEAEAYWGMCLCKYGIEYVLDEKTNRRIPTCHRTQFKSILEDTDYKKAIENSDLLSKRVYEEEASYIDSVQKGILSISSKEEPFDIFICYKETGENNQRTIDSVLAQDIYTKLTDEGYKVFFARITLEDKLGKAYEPYIFAALNSAKVMLVVGTKPEHFNAVWVKNEWSRYVELIEHGKDVALIPCYKDMNPYELPVEFAALQAQDMGKVGAMQDLIRGIKKIHNIKATNESDNAGVKSEIDISNLMSGNAGSVLKRGYIYLGEGDFARAKECFEKSLYMSPELGAAYWGIVLAMAKCKSNDDMISRGRAIPNSSAYKSAMGFATPEEKVEYDRVKDGIVKTVVGTINKLQAKKAEAIIKSGAKEALAKSEAFVAGAAKEIQDGIKRLKEIEAELANCIETCKAMNSEAIQSIKRDLAVAIKIRTTVESNMKIATGDLQVYKDEFEKYASQMKNSVEKIAQNKKEPAFSKLFALTEEQTKISVRLSDGIPKEAYGYERRLSDLVEEVGEIAEKYNKAINDVKTGNYDLAKELLG